MRKFETLLEKQLTYQLYDLQELYDRLLEEHNILLKDYVEKQRDHNMLKSENDELRYDCNIDRRNW